MTEHDVGREPVTERTLRRVLINLCCEEQRPCGWRCGPGPS